jgi:hypothetical protein
LLRECTLFVEMLFRPYLVFFLYQMVPSVLNA